MSYRAGIIAGLLTAIIMIIASSIINYSFAIGEPNATYAFNPFSLSLFNSLVGGVFWGLIYAYFYSRIPGSTSIKKSFVLSAFLVIITSVFGLTVALSGLAGTVDIFDSYYTSEYVKAFASFIIFGLFLGYFYDRFKQPRPNSSPTGTPPKQ